MSDLCNVKYGRWIVLSFFGKRGKHKLWNCICECGIEKIIFETNLVSGKSLSCGCHRVEVGKKNYKSIAGKQRKYANAQTAVAAQAWRQYYSNGCSFEKFLELSQMNCYYCGEPPSNCAKMHKSENYSQEWADGYFIYNGLDRIDNSKNHSEDNIVPCCKNCNYAKRNRNFDDYILWVKKSYDKLFNV